MSDVFFFTFLAVEPAPGSSRAEAVVRISGEDQQRQLRIGLLLPGDGSVQGFVDDLTVSRSR